MPFLFFALLQTASRVYYISNQTLVYASEIHLVIFSTEWSAKPVSHENIYVS